MEIDSIKNELKQTLHFDSTQRLNAEKCLKQREGPNFAILLLQIVEADNQSDINVAQAASIYFKNFACKFWHLAPENSISELEREKIKNNIINLMMKIPPIISTNLKEALKEICKCDFPTKWNNLLPTLVEKLNHFETSKCALEILDAIFIKFRHERRTIENDKIISYSAPILINPLTEFFRKILYSLIQNGYGEKSVDILKITVLVFSILRSLISYELLEEIEKISEIWMEGFLKIMEATKNNVKNAPPCLLREFSDNISNIFKILSLFCDRFEDCQQYNNAQINFVKLTFDILSITNSDPEYDNIVINGLEYLKSVAGKHWNKSIFKKEGIEIILKNIIFPNIYLREVDIEDFEDNPSEYFKKDLDSSHSSRRKAAFDVIKILNENYGDIVQKFVFSFIEALYFEYQKNPQSNWAQKDAALFLVITICGKGKTERYGIMELEKNFNMENFLKNTIIPELCGNTSHPILKADCIQILVLFRSFVSEYEQIIKLMGKMLSDKNLVIKTYAAKAIEKFVTLKNRDGDHLLNLNGIKSILKEVLNNLYQVLETNEMFGNEYIIRAITCVINRAGSELIPFFETILMLSYNNLIKTIKNQTNAQFNHYVYESLAAIISSVCSHKNDLILAFEIKFFPIFELILNSDNCSSFHAYVFQILAQMIRVRKVINPVYLKLFPILLNPKFWIEMANVDAMSKLLIEYLANSPSELSNKIEALLGVFQQLLSQKSNDQNAFRVLLALIAGFSFNQISKYMPQILKLICFKLDKDRTKRFITHFCVFFCSLTALIGFEAVYNYFENIQNGMTNKLIEQFILPSTSNLHDKQSKKNVVIGLSEIIGSPLFKQKFADGQFVMILKEILDIISLKFDIKPNFDFDSDLEDLKRDGYSAQYSKLAFARIEQHDPFLKIKEPKLFFLQKLFSLSQKFPNKIGALIDEYLVESKKSQLLSYLKIAEISLL